MTVAKSQTGAIATAIALDMRARQTVSLLYVRALILASALLLASAGATTAREPASAGPSSSVGRFAPLDRPGPTLNIARATVQKALICSRPVAARGRPVLLVPGTGTIPSVDYRWNYERAFTAKGIAWCALTLPASANGDIQKAGECIVSAIRTMASASGQKIDVFGWSQGGMVPRWALRFWPDTRALVADVVGLAPSNHGTVDVADACRIACLPALRQQGTTSHFIAALNSYAETFPGIAYTSIYTRHDDIVQPNLNTMGSSSLHTGGGVISNVAVQDVCPDNTARHFAVGTYDPVAYALVIDALSHSGRGAAAARIPAAICRQRYQPGVDPATFDYDFAALKAYVAAHQRVGGVSRAEPPLAPYVFAPLIR